MPMDKKRAREDDDKPESVLPVRSGKIARKTGETEVLTLHLQPPWDAELSMVDRRSPLVAD